jgi:hypothetical protein
MILDCEVQGNVGDRLSFDSDKNSREVGAREANGVNGVGVGKRSRGVNDMSTLPMFEREIRDGEGSHGFMLKEESVVGLVMALKEHRNLSAKEWPIVDGTVAVRNRGENSYPGSPGGGEKGHPVRSTAQVGSFQDESVGLLVGGDDEGEGQIIEMPKVDEGHVNIDIIWPDRLFQVLSIKGLKLRVGDGQERISITRELSVPRHHSSIQRDEISTGRWSIVFVRRPIPKNELLRVILFLRAGVPVGAHGDRHHKPAGGAGVVAGEAKVAEERGKGTIPVGGSTQVVHGESESGGKRGVRE